MRAATPTISVRRYDGATTHAGTRVRGLDRSFGDDELHDPPVIGVAEHDPRVCAQRRKDPQRSDARSILRERPHEQSLGLLVEVVERARPPRHPSPRAHTPRRRSAGPGRARHRPRCAGRGRRADASPAIAAVVAAAQCRRSAGRPGTMYRRPAGRRDRIERADRAERRAVDPHVRTEPAARGRRERRCVERVVEHPRVAVDGRHRGRGCAAADCAATSPSCRALSFSTRGGVFVGRQSDESVDDGQPLVAQRRQAPARPDRAARRHRRDAWSRRAGAGSS